MLNIQKPAVALVLLGATLLPIWGGPLARPAQAAPSGRDLVIIGGIIAGYGALKNNRNNRYGYGGNSHQRHDQQDEARRHGGYNNGGYNNGGYYGNGGYNNNGYYGGNSGYYGGGNNGYYNGGNRGYYGSNYGNRGHHHD